MKRQKHLDILSPVSVRQKSTPKDSWGHCVLAPLGFLVPGNEEEGLGLVERWSCTSAGPMQNWGSCQTVESCVGLNVGRSSRACTVTPTFTRPRSSRMWCGRHSLSWVNREMSFCSFYSEKIFLKGGVFRQYLTVKSFSGRQIWPETNRTHLSFIIYDSDSSSGEGSRIKAKTRPVSVHDITCRNCMELVLRGQRWISPWKVINLHRIYWYIAK